MPGLPRSIRNNLLSKGFLFLITAIISFACSGTEELSKPPSSGIAVKDFLAKYEKTFNPADYDTDINSIEQAESNSHNQLENSLLVTTALPETITGFRIQLFLTQEIDAANHVRDSIGTQFPDEWVYTVYDAPYYKVRLGNFANRQTANQMVKKTIDAGYKDAWVVPDKVLKNPPPKPPDVLIEPDHPLEEHR